MYVIEAVGLDISRAGGEGSKPRSYTSVPGNAGIGMGLEGDGIQTPRDDRGHRAENINRKD